MGGHGGGRAGSAPSWWAPARAGRWARSTGTGGSGATITLYSGQHEETTVALVKAFEARTGINVKVRNDDEDVLAQQIAQEGSQSPADVFYTENSPPLMSLQAKGLLVAGRPGHVGRRPAPLQLPQR